MVLCIQMMQSHVSLLHRGNCTTSKMDLHTPWLNAQSNCWSFQNSQQPTAHFLFFNKGYLRHFVIVGIVGMEHERFQERERSRLRGARSKGGRPRRRKRGKPEPRRTHRGAAAVVGGGNDLDRKIFNHGD